MVVLDSIKVIGSRLPQESVIRLSGLKVGDKVNDLIVTTACHKVTATGLVKSVEYTYDLYPNKPGVGLKLTLVDEMPLLPAHIKPVEQEDHLWQSLTAIDPIFTRELPRTEKALSFYADNLGTVLKHEGHPDEYAAPDVVSGSDGSVNGISFEIRKYKNAP